MSKMIYCWHDPYQCAIKCGMTEVDSTARMTSYAYEHGLSPDNETLQSFALPNMIDARAVERHCHTMLVHNGMTRFPDSCTELFHLRGYEYSKALSMVRTMVDRCIEANRTGTEQIDYVIEPPVPLVGRDHTGRFVSLNPSKPRADISGSSVGPGEYHLSDADFQRIVSRMPQESTARKAAARLGTSGTQGSLYPATEWERCPTCKDLKEKGTVHCP